MPTTEDSQYAIENGSTAKIKFDTKGLVPVVTTDSKTKQVLMMAYMNAEALEKTISTGEAHYWSRSRKQLWHKGETTGQIQKVDDIRIDCDQDALWMSVQVQGNGGCCHVGYQSCFYRRFTIGAIRMRYSKPMWKN